MKIGWAGDPKQRMRSLQCGNPRALRFIGMIPGTMHDEAGWHALFAYLRIGGEWFRSARDLLTAIEALPLIDLPHGADERGSTAVPADDQHRAMMRAVRRLPEPSMDEVRAALSRATPIH